MSLKIKDYIFGTNWLTKQERMVFCVIVGMLLIGWAVRNYRMAHPPEVAAAVAEAKP